MMFLQIMLTFTHLVVGFILVCEIMLLINYHHGVFHVSFLDIAVCTKVFGAWTSQHPGSTLLAMPNLINFTFPSPTQDLFLRSHTWDSFSLMNLLSLSLSLCLLLPNLLHNRLCHCCLALVAYVLQKTLPLLFLRLQMSLNLIWFVPFQQVTLW